MQIVALVVGVAVSTLLLRSSLGMTLVAVLLGFLLRVVHAGDRAALPGQAPGQQVRPPAARHPHPHREQPVHRVLAAAGARRRGQGRRGALGQGVLAATPRPGSAPTSPSRSSACPTGMDSGNMRWTAMAIRIQREVGGDLAETLRTTTKTLREREEVLGRHVRGLSAEGQALGLHPHRPARRHLPLHDADEQGVGRAAVDAADGDGNAGRWPRLTRHRLVLDAQTRGCEGLTWEPCC